MKLASKLKHLLTRSTKVSGSACTTWIGGSSQRRSRGRRGSSGCGRASRSWRMGPRPGGPDRPSPSPPRLPAAAGHGGGRGPAPPCGALRRRPVCHGRPELRGSGPAAPAADAQGEPSTMRRRTFLLTGTAGLSALAAPALLRAQGATLKVGTYGGYFQESFETHIYPDFTAETGIAVESIGEPTGEAWLVQLEQAARAGQAPADVSMMAQVARLRGEPSELWAPLDEVQARQSRQPARALPPPLSRRPPLRHRRGELVHHARHQHRGLPRGADLVAGALGPGQRRQARAPRARLQLVPPRDHRHHLLRRHRHPRHRGRGTQVLEKLAEVKPNVRLWYRDEGQFQQALESGEIPMGQYYHDVTGLAAAERPAGALDLPGRGRGARLRAPGCLQGLARCSSRRRSSSTTWPGPRSRRSCRATSAPRPPCDRELTDLTDEEFAAVASDAAPILPRYDLYVERADWVNQKWSEMITAG